MIDLILCIGKEDNFLSIVLEEPRFDSQFMHVRLQASYEVILSNYFDDMGRIIVLDDMEESSIFAVVCI